MAVYHSPDEEKSLYDLALEAEEDWDQDRPASINALARDALTIEVKSDEMALSTGNAFIETGRTNGDVSGINISQAHLWVQALGRVLVAVSTDRLRAAVEGWLRTHELRELPGGDRDATLGVPVPALWALQAPVAAADKLPRVPRVYEVEFAEGSLAATVAMTRGGAQLKDVNSNMSFPKDVVYGEAGENYAGALLGALPLESTRILDRTGVLQLSNRPIDGLPHPHLDIEFERDGEKAGIGTISGHLWVIDLGGSFVICPTDVVRFAARLYFKPNDRNYFTGGHSIESRPEQVGVVHVPLWVARNNHVSPRQPPHGLLMAAGSQLPEGLPGPLVRELA